MPSNATLLVSFDNDLRNEKFGTNPGHCRVLIRRMVVVVVVVVVAVVVVFAVDVVVDDPWIVLVCQRKQIFP